MEPEIDTRPIIDDLCSRIEGWCLKIVLVCYRPELRTLPPRVACLYRFKSNYLLRWAPIMSDYEFWDVTGLRCTRPEVRAKFLEWGTLQGQPRKETAKEETAKEFLRKLDSLGVPWGFHLDSFGVPWGNEAHKQFAKRLEELLKTDLAPGSRGSQARG